MRLTIKEKLINGKVVQGVISETLREIVPFCFKKIIEYNTSCDDYYNIKYFICEMEDGSSSLYQVYPNSKESRCLIDYKEGYSNLRILKHSSSSSPKLIATKEEQEGIIGFEEVRENSEIVGTKIKVLYPFGECDEIVEQSDTSVRLIRHLKTGDRIGYWYHKDIDGQLKPEYLSIDYFTVSKPIGLYTYKDECGSRHNSYHKNGKIEYDKLTTNVELMKYTKFSQGKPVVGIKQRTVYGKFYSRASFSCRFEDLFPAKYSRISYDSKKQIFYLEQRINGKTKYGMVGVTFNWHTYTHGYLMWGYPTLRIVVDFPCIYDSLKLIDNNHALVSIDGKFGIISFSFNKSEGDYDFWNHENYADAKKREVAPCIYDEIRIFKDNYIGVINGEERVFSDAVSGQDNENLQSDTYKKVTLVHDSLFLGEKETGKKELIFVEKQQNSYSFFKKGTIKKVLECDSASVIVNKDGNVLIKTQNAGVTSIYHKDSKSIKLVISNILVDDYYQVDSNTDNFYYPLKKPNGHIIVINEFGMTILDTEELDITLDNLTVEYLKEISKFKVTNGGKIRICPFNKNYSDNRIYRDRIFKTFDAIDVGNYLFIGYKEVNLEETTNALSRIDIGYGGVAKEVLLLKGNFQVENIVVCGSRIIFSTIDSKTKKKLFGVIESNEGNVCIEANYDSIKLDSSGEFFICEKDGQEVIFDIYGFIRESESKTPNNSMRILRPEF